LQGADFPVSFDPVYKLVKQIPRGRVLTYGAIAKALRVPGGARTVGRAMGATPKGKGIPWHRVLGANGKILIREPYASLQKKLLESEGVSVVESRINVKKHLWSPPRRKFRPSRKPADPSRLGDSVTRRAGRQNLYPKRRNRSMR
jgi:methylated-DNA-protein-cysteine methyltransferase-like protein